MVYTFHDFILKCDKPKHIETYENDIMDSDDCYLNVLRVKLDASLSYDKINGKITKETQMLNYCIDLNKKDIGKFEVDLYVDRENAVHLLETLKMLTDYGFSSNVFFVDYALNGYYNSGLDLKKTVYDGCGFYYMMLNAIMDDKSLLISNREKAIQMLNNFMKMKCWSKTEIQHIFLDVDFTLSVCPKINFTTGLNPFDCLENEILTEKTMKKYSEVIRSHCLGCNCEAFC